MLLSKKEILEKIKEGMLVLNMIDPAVQIQQAGVDLTVGRIYTLKGEGALDFDNSKRKIPEYEVIEPANEKWVLEPGTYHAAMNETIKLPDNIAGLLLPRSSALTCGLEVHSALWDPGYEGRSFMHFSLKKKIELHKNARICQMIFFLLENTEEYRGSYTGEDIFKNMKRG
ncbi:MAG: deoxyuridine 5'-triphosphate nucleotidohydrolase [Candidatus Aenigmarchaeota archaeon]|nr:deoxyuridine 5'-triphosphate nucleotidohydrolase [Candidatus Aenigmarchaeota archaeon]